ncbi:MAG: caspase family protein, partial [Cyanobacteria bacterium P01_F01_bin.143]
FKIIHSFKSCNKLLTLDTVGLHEDNWEIQDNNLSLIAGKVGLESTFQDKKYGMFSYCLSQQLLNSSNNLTLEELCSKIREDKNYSGPEKKLTIIGDNNKQIFNDRSEYHTVIEELYFSNLHSLDLKVLNQKFSFLNQRIKYFSNSYLSSLYLEKFATAFLSKKDYKRALKELKKIQNKNYFNNRRISFKIWKSQIHDYLYDQAFDILKHYASNIDDTLYYCQIKETINNLEKLNSSDFKNALLVGVGSYSTDTIDPLRPIRGVKNDIELMRDVLINQLNFSEGNIKVLINDEAKRNNIIDEFKQLVDKSCSSPALFYFAGYGSSNINNNLTIVASDSRNPDIFDIEITELKNIIGNRKNNLVSIIDAGWSEEFHQETYTRSHRNLIQDDRYVPIKRALVITNENVTTNKRDLLLQNFQLGDISIYNFSIKYKSVGKTYSYPYIEQNYQEKSSENKVYGVLTYQFAEIIRHTDFLDRLTFLDLANSLQEINAVVIGDNLEFRVFENSVVRKQIINSIKQIEAEPLERLINILQRQIEQRNGFDPEGYLNLGIAYYFLEEYEKSVKALENCLYKKLDNNQLSLSQEGNYGDNPTAHYWLGRVLYESKKDPARAVSELRLATKLNADNSFAQYYLGQALRVLVEQEILSEAENAFQNYLDAGSPLGREEEIQEFLKSRKETKSQSNLR